MLKKTLICLAMLTCSNIFMNAAWYGHLKYKSSPLIVAILASWGIAFFEYCLQVPANRIGNEALTVTQLKVGQEILSLVTFAVFSVVVFHTKLTLNHALAFVLIVIAAWLVVKG